MAPVNVETLEALSKDSPFDHWEGVVTSQKLALCRRIVREAACQLLLTARADVATRSAILCGAVNELSGAGDGFTCKSERADLCRQLAAIGAAAGLTEAQIGDALKAWLSPPGPHGS